MIFPNRLLGKRFLMTISTWGKSWRATPPEAVTAPDGCVMLHCEQGVNRSCALAMALRCLVQEGNRDRLEKICQIWKVNDADDARSNAYRI